MVLCTLHRHQNQDLAGWPDIGAGYPFTPDIELWKKIIYEKFTANKSYFQPDIRYLTLSQMPDIRQLNFRPIP